MEPIYRQKFTIDDMVSDCFGSLKLSALLYYAQEAAGNHSALLGVDHDTLANHRLFWAVTRHRVQIARLPKRGETITVETWPMPTTKIAYPRSMVAFDENGNELFRSISLWVLMDMDNRSMILPGKSGIIVDGSVTGNELAVPHSIIPKVMTNEQQRAVTYSCLDRNGHMNNTRYLDWVEDLLPAEFHREHPVKEFTVCYLNEALEGEEVALNWQLDGEGNLHVHAAESTGGKRVFSAEVLL
jgi:acyl-ACP thioesterase